MILAGFTFPKRRWVFLEVTLDEHGVDVDLVGAGA